MEKIPIYVPVSKVNTKTPWGFFYWYYKRVKRITPMIDPRFEDDAIAMLMEEALTQTTEETKFDVDAYFNSDIDY